MIVNFGYKNDFNGMGRDIEVKQKDLLLYIGSENIDVYKIDNFQKWHHFLFKNKILIRKIINTHPWWFKEII